jgi:hypothetical protein
MSTDLEQDLEFITNSLRMLPSWENEEDWWRRFSEITDYSLEYLTEKLAWITRYWRQGGAREPDFASDRAQYVLMFFDNPALYEHLDEVAEWSRARNLRGRVGRRWSEELCAAAWRVLIAEEPNNPDSHNFSVPAIP